MADDIKKIIQDTAKATAKEVNQDLGVKMEALQSDMKQVLEGVETNTQQLERLQTLPEDVEHIRDDVEAIKVTMGIIKNDLKQKVDREEFVALEQRVVQLEARQKS